VKVSNLPTSKQKAPLDSDSQAAAADGVEEIAGRKAVAKTSKPKAAKPPARIPEIDALERSVSTRKIQILTARISELEDRLVASELESNSHGHVARIRRLEKDVATYREARAAAEFAVTDLRAALDRAALSVEQLRTSPSYRLGALLFDAVQDWRQFLRLPASLVQWAREARRYREEIEGQLIPVGSATEFTATIERALEIAEKQGLHEAERWAVDQRLRAQVLGRVLSELAGVARRSDPGEAVRLAEAALEADPNESRVKRLAFLMAESGSVTHASQLLRAAIEKGAATNGAEETRAQELFALADLAAAGPSLMPRRRAVVSVGAANRRVLILAPQTYPFHWSSASIRTHAMAESLTEANILVDVVSFPGYPNIGRREPVDYPPMRNIEGVDYYLLPPTPATPGFGDDYVKQTSAMIASLMKRLGTSIVIAPSDLQHAYPAAVASQIASVSLVLDCWSVAPGAEACRTERAQIVSRTESALLPYAKVAMARTPAIAERLRQAAPALELFVAPETTPRASSKPLEPRADNGEFVFGYIGDNAPDVDIEGLSVLLRRLVDAQVNARLVIYSVGARIQAIRDQLELANLGGRATIIEKSPPGRRAEIAYSALDAVVIPFRPTEDVVKSPFQIFSALRHGKCVVVVGTEDYGDVLGPAVIQAPDLDAAFQTLSALAGDAGQVHRQEAEARAWDAAHPSNSLLAKALEAL
jgi:hypothetical protein